MKPGDKVVYKGAPGRGVGRVESVNTLAKVEWPSGFRDTYNVDTLELVDDINLNSGADTPWPLRDVLAKLAEAADILLKQLDYDGLGWESIAHAREAARVLLAPARSKPVLHQRVGNSGVCECFSCKVGGGR